MMTLKKMLFVRSRDDGACWNNPQTNTKLCAW
jgi:hypothetical protein